MSENKRSLIDLVEVRVPCRAKWEEMTGNDRVRFCEHCSKEVNNFSALTRKEAMRLVQASDGNLCIRYVTDTRGHRPVFFDQLVGITRRRPRIAAGALSAAFGLSAVTYAQDDPAKTSNQQLQTVTYPVMRDPAKEDNAVKSFVEGTVRGVDGVPVAGVGVRLSTSSDAYVDDVTTDEVGHYRFEDVDQGTYFVRVLSSNGNWKKAAPPFDVKYGSPYFQDLTVRVVHTKSDEQGAGTEFGVGMGGAMAMPRYESELSQAIFQSDVQQIRNLLAAGSNVNAREPNYSNVTPIFLAVEHADVQVVRLLLNAGAKVNARDDQGNTPLMSIDRDATPELVRMLLDAGAKVNARNKDGSSPLFSAVATGDADVVRLLIVAGAEVNAETKDEKVTPLMRAVEADNANIVRLLLDSGADAKAIDAAGETVWEKSSDPDIDDLLVKAGAVAEYDIEVRVCDDCPAAKENDTPTPDATPSPAPEPTPPI